MNGLKKNESLIRLGSAAELDIAREYGVPDAKRYDIVIHNWKKGSYRVLPDDFAIAPDEMQSYYQFCREQEAIRQQYIMDHGLIDQFANSGKRMYGIGSIYPGPQEFFHYIYE